MPWFCAAPFSPRLPDPETPRKRGSLHACLGVCVRVRASQASASAAPKKLQMTVTYDKINADLLLRFDRKPEVKDEWDLINTMKTKYNFKWQGYAETGKWQTDKLAIVAFEDKEFKARIKCACTALSLACSREPSSSSSSA